MIVYDPGKWGGFHKLIQLNGSVLPSILPQCIVSTLLVIWVHYQDLIYFPRSPYAHQIFTFGLSFLVIMRTNLSYSRYWEGISELVAMHSKWTDAVSQIIAFDELSSGPPASAGEKFRLHIVHIMTLMSATIVLKFQEGGLGEAPDHIVPFEAMGLEPPKSSASTKGSPPTGKFTQVLPGAEPDSPTDSPAKSDGKTRKAGKPTKVAKVEPVPPPPQKAANEGDDEPLPVVGGISNTEIKALIDADCEGCAVHFLMQKVVRLVSRRHKNGGLAAPPPIVSRVFQELSNGFLHFQSANKVATIPFPFPYAQIVQFQLLAFVLSCPFVVVAFVDELGFQMFFTFLAVFTFSSLNAVAAQLEDPFGHDANDLPLRQLHTHFVSTLWQLNASEMNEADLDALEANQEDQSLAQIEQAAKQAAIEQQEVDEFEKGAERLVNQMNTQVAGVNGGVLHETALKQLFDSLDKNKNGVLDHDELRELCRRIGLGFSDEKYSHMLKKVDPDATGEVEFTELWDWFMKKHKKSAKKKLKAQTANGEISDATSPRNAAAAVTWPPSADREQLRGAEKVTRSVSPTSKPTSSATATT